MNRIILPPLTLNCLSITFLASFMPAGASEGKKTERMGAGEWIEPRRLSGGFFISPKDAQILRLLAPSLGRVRSCRLHSAAPLFTFLMCFTAQNRSYIVMLLEHFTNLKSFIWNQSLNYFFYLPSFAGHPLQEPEWKQGRPGLSYVQVSVNSTASQSAESWFGYWDLGR